MKNRVNEYDVVRFLAITLVFSLHFTSSAIRNSNSEIDLDQSYIKYFGFGVQLFFVLSAFLASYKIDLLEVKPTDYIIGRLKRLLPTHIIIFTVLILSAISLRLSPDSVRIVSGLFLSDQVFFINFNMINPVIWSLEVELQFYFFVYVLLLVKIKLGLRVTPFTMGVFMLLIFLCCSDLYKNRTLLNYSIYFSLGCFIYEIEKKIPITRSFIFDLSFLASIVVIPMIFDSSLSLFVKKLSVALCTGIIIFSSVRIKILRGLLVNNITLSIGLSSYSFYLLHFALIEGYFLLASPISKMNFFGDYVVVFSLTSILSYLSYRFIELNKLFYSN